MLDKITPIAAIESEPVSDSEQRAIERFLFREARLLDREDYNGWLALIDEDIRYWMPAIETRRRDDPRGSYVYGNSAYFDDDIHTLGTRVKRYMEPTAWADNPGTRHVHLISNIEAYATADQALVAVFSSFSNIRNRNERDEEVIYGRREDLLVRVDGSYKIRQRTVIPVWNVLLSKNLNTFF